jgi:hypothetical protein
LEARPAPLARPGWLVLAWLVLAWVVLASGAPGRPGPAPVPGMIRILGWPVVPPRRPLPPG